MSGESNWNYYLTNFKGLGKAALHFLGTKRAFDPEDCVWAMREHLDSDQTDKTPLLLA